MKHFQLWPTDHHRFIFPWWWFIGMLIVLYISAIWFPNCMMTHPETGAALFSEWKIMALCYTVFVGGLAIVCYIVEKIIVEKIHHFEQMMFPEPPTKKHDPTLEELVKRYINELANPAPDYNMRLIYQAWLAEKVGMEDPAVTKRKWNESARSLKDPRGLSNEPHD